MKNYAIIDHAGSVGAYKELYRRAFAAAKGFEKVFTLKNVCIQYSPYAREITDKMKYFHRYNRNPKMVYIVCASQFEPKAQFIANIWESRNIPVVFIEENPTSTAISAIMTPARRFAIIWSRARGWEFSAPLFREPTTESIDEYTARPDMQNETGSYSAKRMTSPQRYIENFRAIAPEEECQAFKANLDYYFQTKELQNFLDPDWDICPVCGYPHRINAEKCDICDHEFEAFEFKTFYEDSYNDDPDINYESTPSSASLPQFADIEWTHEDASTAKYEKELPWIQLLNTVRFDFSKDTEHTPINFSNLNRMAITPIKEKTSVNSVYTACDPDGDPTIHQLYWKRALEHEAESKKLDTLLKDITVPEEEITVELPRQKKTYFEYYPIG